MRLLLPAVVVLLAGGCTVPDADATLLRTLDAGFWEWETPRGLAALSVESGNTDEVGVYRSQAAAERALEPLELEAELAAVNWDEDAVVLGLYWVSSHGDQWLELTGVQVRESAVQVEGIDYRRLTESGDFVSHDASAVLYSVVVTTTLPTDTGGTLTVESFYEPASE